MSTKNWLNEGVLDTGVPYIVEYEYIYKIYNKAAADKVVTDIDDYIDLVNEFDEMLG